MQEDYTTEWENCQLLPFVPPSRIGTLVEKALEMWDRFPSLRKKIEADRDDYAVERKILRMKQAAHEQSRGTDSFDDWQQTGEQSVSMAPDPDLESGRRRTPAIVIYLFLILRGAYNSVSDIDTIDRFRDSLAVRTALLRFLPSFPGRSTLVENLNMISHQTRAHILDVQLAHIRDQQYDAMETVLADSTATWANSAWPTESSLLYKFLARAFSIGQNLEERHQLPNFRVGHCARWLAELKGADLGINTANGKRDASRRRKRAYAKLYARTGKFLLHMAREFDRLEHTVAEQITLLGPLMGRVLAKEWAELDNCLVEAYSLLYYSAERVLGTEEKSAREEHEEIFSVSDRTARLIYKGGREPVFGYKPQLAESRNGFITAVQLDMGNVADSTQLVDLVNEHVRRAQPAALTMISADDGYSSRAQRDALLEQYGADTVVSISGSKGKKLIGEELWNSKPYREARRLRPTAESRIWVLKHSFAFGQLRRRGLDKVRCELVEKVIAYNFYRMGVIDEQQRQEQRRREQERAMAA